MWKAACGVLGCGAVFCAQAGVWQMQRKKWKEDLVQHRDATLQLPPLAFASRPFPWVTDPATDYEFHRVAVTGTFLHKLEMRMMRAQADQPGYKLYTPLRLKDGSTLIVGRGWVPSALADWRTRAEPAGEVTVEGVLRQTDTQGKYTPANLPKLNEWHYVNLDEMTKTAGVGDSAERYYVQCVDFHSRTLYGFNDGDGPAPDKPSSLMTWWATPETHMSYAAFWFSSSLVCLWFLVRTYRHR